GARVVRRPLCRPPAERHALEGIPCLGGSSSAAGGGAAVPAGIQRRRALQRSELKAPTAARNRPGSRACRSGMSADGRSVRENQATSIDSDDTVGDWLTEARAAKTTS